MNRIILNIHDIHLVARKELHNITQDDFVALERIQHVQKVVDLFGELLLGRGDVDVHLLVEFDELVIGDNAIIVRIDHLKKIKEFSKEFLVFTKLEG